MDRILFFISSPGDNRLPDLFAVVWTLWWKPMVLLNLG